MPPIHHRDLDGREYSVDTVAAFDIGQTHLAVAFMSMGAEPGSDTLDLLHRIDFEPLPQGGNREDKARALCHEVVTALQRLEQHLPDDKSRCVFVIEQQDHGRTFVKRNLQVQFYLQAAIEAKFGSQPVISAADAKSRLLGAAVQGAGNYAARKKRAVELTDRLLQSQTVNIKVGVRTAWRDASKKDDIADALMHAIAFCGLFADRDHKLEVEQPPTTQSVSRKRRAGAA